MSAISVSQFNIKNIKIGQIESKNAKGSGESYQSASISYEGPNGSGRFNLSSVDITGKNKGNVIFYGCRLLKVMKYGTKDTWTGEYQLAVPLYQTPALPSKEELKFIDVINQVRRKVAIELGTDDGDQSTEDEIVKALEGVKNPISYKMLYALDNKGAVIITKNGKKKVKGIDSSKSPCMYIKLYIKKEEGSDQVKINTRFLDSSYNQIQTPEDLIGKLIDCCLELKVDSVYKGSSGLSIQIKVGEVGVIRQREGINPSVPALKGFMDVLPKLPEPETLSNQDVSSPDEE